ncbi:MAG TPA: hypothetical protein VGR02_04160 [Thermoanaerobaculia bacterium]|nr:hypothetical protein [Thermoanaerobaculia bacterium]
MSSAPHDVHRDTVIARFAKLQSFVTSALIVLCILTVVTEQQIREFEEDVQILARRRREAAARMQPTLQKLRAVAKTLQSAVADPVRARMGVIETASKNREVDYTKLSAILGLSAKDIPALQGCMRFAWSGRLASFPSPLEFSDDDEKDAYRIVARVSGLESEDQQAIQQQLRLPPPTNSAKRRADLESVTKKLAQNDMFKQALPQFEKFAELFDAYVADRAALKPIEDKVAEVRNTKQSLPSPFGNFNMHPRLALVFLAFAAAGTYLLFAASERRTLRIARDIAPESPPMESPPWAFTREVPLRRVLGWREASGLRLTSGLALHAFWLGLSVFLLTEVLRWRAVHLLRMMPAVVVTLILVGMNGAAGAMALSHFVALRIPARLAGAVQTAREGAISRRTAVRLSAVSLFAVLFGGLRRQHVLVAWPATEHPALDISVWLVQNAKTLIAHSVKYCRDHLPKRRVVLQGNWGRAEHRVAPMGHPHLHRQYAVATLFEGAKAEREHLERLRSRANEDNSDELWDLYGRQAPEVTERVLDLLYHGLELQPWSFHLYDQIIAALGDQRRYNDIRAFLDRMMRAAQDTLQVDPQSRAARNRVRGIAARIHGVETRVTTSRRRKSKRHQPQVQQKTGAVLPPGAAP